MKLHGVEHPVARGVGLRAGAVSDLLAAQRLPLRKTGFYGTLVAAAAFMLTSWFAVGERREMLDDTQAVVMSLSTAVKSSPDKSATDLFVLHEERSSRSPTAWTTGARSPLPTARKGGSNVKRSKRFRCRNFYRMSSASFQARAWDAARRCAWPSTSCAWSGIRWPEMTRSIDRFRNEVKYCSLCNNLSDEEVCPICADRERDHATICVVEQVADVLSIENTRQYRGIYHVLG